MIWIVAKVLYPLGSESLLCFSTQNLLTDTKPEQASYAWDPKDVGEILHDNPYSSVCLHPPANMRILLVESGSASLYDSISVFCALAYSQSVRHPKTLYEGVDLAWLSPSRARKFQLCSHGTITGLNINFRRLLFRWLMGTLVPFI